MKLAYLALSVSIFGLTACGGGSESIPKSVAPTTAPTATPAVTIAPTGYKSLQTGAGVLIYEGMKFQAYGANSGIAPIETTGCPFKLEVMDKRSNDLVIGAATNAEQLYEIDPYAAKCKIIASMPEGMRALTVAADGSIYASGANSGGLWHLTENGARISFVPLSGELIKVSGLGFSNGKLIGTEISSNKIVQIDPVTGVNTLLRSVSMLPSADIDIDTEGNLRGINSTTQKLITIRLSDGVLIDSVATISRFSPVVYKK